MMMPSPSRCSSWSRQFFVREKKQLLKKETDALSPTALKQHISNTSPFFFRGLLTVLLNETLCFWCALINSYFLCAIIQDVGSNCVTCPQIKQNMGTNCILCAEINQDEGTGCISWPQMIIEVGTNCILFAQLIQNELCTYNTVESWVLHLVKHSLGMFFKSLYGLAKTLSHQTEFKSSYKEKKKFVYAFILKSYELLWPWLQMYNTINLN